MQKFVTPQSRHPLPRITWGVFDRSFLPGVAARTAILAGVLLLTGAPGNLLAQGTFIEMGSTWRYTRGTNEASNPVTAWRALSYNDQGLRWSNGQAPFHYGDGLTTGTELTDMRNNYTCVYFRRTFVVTNTTDLDSLVLDANYDDGFIAWVNGTEIARVLVTNTTYTSTASGSHEAGTVVSFEKYAPTFVATGTNILAVQAFNVSRTSTDFRFDAALRATYREQNPPSITAATPAPGASLSSLSSVMVTFSEGVYGVEAADLLVNDLPATGVLGTQGTNRWLFSFAQPGPGQVQISWDQAHGITDAAGNLFNSEAGPASWAYDLADTSGPRLAAVAPVAGAQVNRLTQAQVIFDEPVTGVSAGDLLVNLAAATSVTGTEAGPYVFTFAEPAPGPVSFSWAAGHDIRDLSPAGNAFAGAGWTVTLNLALAAGDVVINEFLAENSVNNHSLDVDENGELQDWIEIRNRGTSAVDLLGWSLTDDPDVPHKWVFPSVVVAPGGYLLVYASEKDRRTVGGGSRLHTNFKLNQFGEYLALMNAAYPPQVVHGFTGRYPEQRQDYSYGLDATNGWRYFYVPTPLGPNSESTIQQMAPQPHFTVTRGFFDSPFTVLLTTPVAGAAIYYTTDGSEPGMANGTVYSQPITVTNTTTLRAATFAPNTLPSRVVTHSYIYLDQVLHQPANPPGFPSIWGLNSGFTAYGGVIPADYEMDLDPLRINPDDPFSDLDPEKLERFRQGMRELPIVSVVMNVQGIFGTNSLHWRSTQKVPVIEKPCSVEMILPNGSTAFAVTAGIRMHGNASREPLKNPKHGFKLKFKGDFGESTLNYRLFEDSAADEYDDLLLRADFNSSWRHWSDTATQGAGAFQRSRATRTRYAWGQDTMRALGHVSPHNRYCHLFINGLYWGTYDFSEQPTARFAENHVSAAAGHDIYEQGALREGTSVAYNTMLAFSNLQTPANYELMKQYLDVTQHIDYLLLHFFTGHQDWGNIKNWYAIRPRAPAPLGRFRYVPWDQECILLNDNVNRVASTDVPSGLHTRLDDNSEYRLEFADRVHRHMVAPDGALTPGANISRWQKWQTLLDKPIVAESMRWGDYRRDVHPYLEGTYQLYTREQHWLAEHDRMVNSYFVVRNTTLLSQLRNAGLYPSVSPAEYREGTAGGKVLASRSVPAGFVVAMTAPAGTIYYTTNGTDPRVAYAGGVAPGATPYNAPITLGQSTTLKARVLQGGAWSALNEATFAVAQLGIPVRFSEIMYNPLGGDGYEFVEVQNIGTLPLDLSRFSFRGIEFIFPPGATLLPGAVYLIASSSNPTAFAVLYPDVFVNGYFGGSLADGGELLVLVDPNAQPVLSVNYDDESGWPLLADGAGFSLEPVSLQGDPQAPASWTASTVLHGTPGFPPSVSVPVPEVILNELMALNVSTVTNGGVQPDWVELRNTTSSDVDLTGWSLTDDSNPRKFIFPAGTIITNGGHLVVWCDSLFAAPGLHTGFALNSNGETVSLFDATNKRRDALTYGIQLGDYSVGKIGGTWQLNQPTPGAANSAAALATPSELVLNEWLTASGPGAPDWVELFNRSTTAPVALQGLYLATSNAVQQIRSLSFVAPRGHVQLRADNDPGAAHLNLNLPAEGGTLRLFDETAVELDAVSYGLQQVGVAEGRLPDGSSSIQAFPGTASPGAPNYVMAYSGPLLNELLARNEKAVVGPWGNYCDWLELYNPGAARAELGGMGLGDSFNAGRRWVFPGGTSIGPGEHLVIWCDGSRPASPMDGPVLNSGFSLSGKSGQAVLFNTAGQPVDSVSYGFQLSDRSIGRTAGEWKLLATPTPGQGNSGAAALGSPTQLRLNEWMASALSGDDWVELYNQDVLPVNMAGLYLTDDPSITGVTRFRIPPLSFIGGRGWVVWQADGNTDQGAHHTSFSLNALGETLRLYDTNRALIDVQDFGIQAAGVSSGRLPDGAGLVVQFPASASPEESNYLPLTNVVINEILAHTDPPLEDAIELLNTSDQPVNVGGWFLSDSQDDLKRYRIPDSTLIDPGGYAVFYQNQFGTADGEQDVPPRFSLNSAHGDAVYLSEADASADLTGYRAAVKFGPTANGVSAGRHVTSVGVDFVPLSRRTFGVDDLQPVEEFRTGTGLANAPPLVGPVVISEIMYHPADEGSNSIPEVEYVELHNAGSAAAQLFDPLHATNRWQIAGGISFEFPPGTSISAGGCLVVVPFDPSLSPEAKAAFVARYGAGIALAGPFSGKLNNAGDTVELLRPDAPQAPPRPNAGYVPYLLVERVAYAGGAPWPVTANGWSNSLHRISPSGYANDPVNWMGAAPSPGTVGVVIPDADGDGMPDWWEDAFGTSRNVPDAGADPDEDGFTNMQEYLAGTLPLDGQSNLRLSISVEPGMARLKFAAGSNRTYSVLFRNALDEQPWLKLQDVDGRATNWQSEVVDTPGSSNRFYRLLTPRLP